MRSSRYRVVGWSVGRFVGPLSVEVCQMYFEAKKTGKGQSSYVNVDSTKEGERKSGDK